MRRLALPFDGSTQATSVETYHVDHCAARRPPRFAAPIPFDGGRSVLATCTPVVHFPVDDLLPGEIVRGRTVAELGAMNQPGGLVSYDHQTSNIIGHARREAGSMPMPTMLATR